VLLTGAGCLKLRAQPIEVADQLSAQRPANRPDCRIRAKQFTERGLPIARLCQVLTHLGRHQIVYSRAVRLGELAIRTDCPGQFLQYCSQPVSDVLIADRAVVLGKAGAVCK
jgi:hypothetical protein